MAFNIESTHPRVTATIHRDFYIDDPIIGKSSIQEFHETKVQVLNILRIAGFELAKYRSNVSLGQKKCFDNYGLTDTKVLGLLWQPTSDRLRYETTCSSISDVITKSYYSVCNHSNI